MASFTDTIKVNIDIASDKATSALSGVKGEVAKAEASFGKLKTAGGTVFDGLKAAGPMALAAAGTAIAGFAVNAIGSFQDSAQEVLRFKTIAGGTAEDASRWIAAFDDYGVSAEAASKLVGKLALSAERSPEKLEMYGASVLTAKDGTLDLNGTLLSVIDALDRAPDAGTRAALGTAAFGKGWQDMAKLIDAGAMDVKAAFEAVSGGQIFSEEDLQNSEEFRLALDNVGDAIEGLQNAIGSQAIPILSDLITIFMTLGDVAGSVPDPIKRIGEEIVRWNPITGPYVHFKDALGAIAGSAEADVVVLGEVNDVTGELEGSTADLAAQEKELKDRLDAVKASLDAQTKAMGEQQQAALGSINSELGYRQAVEGVDDSLMALQTAQAEATAAVLEHGDASVEAVEKNNALEDAGFSLEESILSAAAASAKYAEDQARASGATFTTADQIKAQISGLEALKQRFPELAPAIDAHIAKLNAIPVNKETEIAVHASGLDAIMDQYNLIRSKTVYVDVRGDVHVGGAAAGGFHSGLTMVGEKGPELVNLPAGSYVHTASETKAMMAAPTGSTRTGGGGGGGGSTVVNIYMPPGSDGESVVAALKRFERRNGPIPISTR